MLLSYNTSLFSKNQYYLSSLRKLYSYSFFYKYVPFFINLSLVVTTIEKFYSFLYLFNMRYKFKFIFFKFKHTKRNTIFNTRIFNVLKITETLFYNNYKEKQVSNLIFSTSSLFFKTEVFKKKRIKSLFVKKLFILGSIFFFFSKTHHNWKISLSSIAAYCVLSFSKPNLIL